MPAGTAGDDRLRRQRAVFGGLGVGAGPESLSGFAWLLGALFGGVLHYGLMRNQPLLARAVQPAPLG